MKENLAQILLTYLPSKKSLLKSHPLGQFIRHTTPHMMIKLASISKAYQVEGSVGKGSWAEIPWICVFDREVTQTAQKGYYIVYLFRADMKGVYLSLNQGWTQFKDRFRSVSEAKRKIQASAEMLRNVLNSHTGFNEKRIDLATKQTLGQGYELGHICGKYYDRDNLPEHSVLIDDLRNLLGVYRELKGKLAGKPLLEMFSEHAYECENLYVNEGERPQKEDYDNIKKLIIDIKRPEEIDSLLIELEEEMKGKEIKTRQRLANTIVRNQKIAELVKMKANYVCALCQCSGFEKRKGGLYAEVHHVEELSEHGKDLPSNMICVCPLCHRKIHFGKEINNTVIIQKRVSSSL
ncbi:MAG: DUF3578 domain-containing protein [Candidatus Zapsychrus exili]|nr:DUF3578 domain-containing protein [Candidatus Zapsychrus exili]